MKKLRILVGVVLVAAFLLPTLVSAQGAGITWNSGFQVQNLENEDASIVIMYYNQDGTEAIPGGVSDTIPAMGSKTYYPIHPEGTFNGSVVISSNRQIAAIANLLASGAVTAASATNSFSEGATTVNLPLIMRANYGFDTWFNVQNVGTTTTHVTVTYVPGTAGNAGVTEEADIPPGAAHTFDQAPNTALGDRFVGSAVVTSDGQPLVATVEQVGSTESFMVLMGYNGFVGGSTTVNLPLVMALNYGFYTGIQCQNGGTDSTTVTVDYGPNTAGAWEPTDESATVAAGASHTFLQLGGQWTERYVGSATVISDPAQPLMCIVNQVMAGATPPDPDFGTAYEGFDPTAATNKASAPLIMANNYGYYTGVQVQNVSAAACDVTITYSENTVGPWNPAPESVTGLAPGASHTFLQSGGQWTDWYVGSATIEGDGCNVVAIVNEFLPGVSDQFFTYNAFNY
ncbi:MAG TPA: hypothetical protein EYP55_07090 [Anaerolineae bacterium]|nr:hypothetical protein [Anaerolineae bacterium]